ncbi:MAG: NAD-dependent epimerase/dehydratase family protein [Planctomycetes bacterium]|nr:NAD-dependent epimerase/dehydratase family protein [Planctomycetota bacterium]
MYDQEHQDKTPSSRFRVALVGAGMIAEYHLTILRTLPFVELVAIVDRDLERARRLAARHGVPHAFAELVELSELRIDVAHVLVPPDQHARLVRLLFDLSIGAYIEKPAALSSSEALELDRQARERELPLGAHHNNVFHPAFARLRARVEAGEIGRVEHVQSTWNLPLAQLDAGNFSHWMFRSPRNIVFEQAVHPLSQVHALLGRVKSSQAHALSTRELETGQLFVDRWSLSAVAERGTAQLFLGFGQGVPRSTIQVIGSDGSLEADLIHDTLSGEQKSSWLEFWNSYRASQGRADALRSDARRVLSSYLKFTLGIGPRRDAFWVGMHNAIHAFYNALRAGLPVPCDGERAAQVLEWCEAAAAPAPPQALREPPLPEPGPVRAGEVVLIGATGFIGKRTVEKLLEAGRAVTIVARRVSGLPPRIGEIVREGRARLFQAALDDAQGLARAFEGAEVVIQLATGGGDTWAEVESAMVKGSVRTAELALAARVKRFVYVSSIAALDTSASGGKALDDSLATDAQPEQRPLYSRGKIATEQALLELHKTRGLPLTIVRPGIVIGAGTPMQHSGYGMWARDNHCIGWGEGAHALPLVWVDDVADALAKLATHPGYSLDGKALNLCAQPSLCARDIVAELAKATGRPIAFHPRSLLLSWWMEIGKWLVKKAGRRAGVEFPSLHDLRCRALDVSFGCTLAREELGWKPVEGTQELLEKAIRIYKR